MTVHTVRLFVYSRPAQTAQTIPAARLNGEKDVFKKKLMVPPTNVDIAPRYAPRIMPINGATIAAVLMFWKAPSRGNIGKKERTT